MNQNSIIPGRMALSRVAIGKLNASTVVKILDKDNTLVYISLMHDGIRKVYSLSHQDFIKDFVLMTVFAGEEDILKKPEDSKSENDKKNKVLSVPGLYASMQ